MKQFLGSLIVSGIVSVMVTSALMVAQVPKSEPSGATITVTRKPELQDADKERRKVPFPAPRVLARAANLDNLVQQYMRQARPIVRAELIFVRRLCELDMEQFRRINHDVEAEFQDTAKRFVEAQQQGRARAAGKVQRTQAVDGLALLREGLASVMKKDLTDEQFVHYQVEVEKRDAHRKQSAIGFLVDAIDRDLFLSDTQRLKLTESIRSHWEESWSLSLEYVLYGNQFYPLGIDAYVTPLLDASQQKIWQGTQKFGGIGGIGGVMGGFMNDNDGLKPELGEVTKADPAKVAPIRRVEVPKR
jgi:hypothetical protein